MILKMKLCSDAAPGSGEGLAGIIDRDVAFDEYGIPIIPAKRIKGILRESARDLHDTGLLQIKTDDLFGIPGSREGCAFKISNGFTLHHDDIARLMEHIDSIESLKPLRSLFNRNNILSFFTYLRNRTAIDRDTGAAMKDTLRFCRVLRRDLIFNFNVECLKEHEGTLRDIAKVTRTFGGSRTRGLGQIKIELEDETATPVSPVTYPASSIDDDQFCRLPIDFMNASPLILSVRVGESQVSEHFIPGSIIQGALASSYIRKAQINAAEDPVFRRLFLSGEVIFNNACPSDGGQRSYYPAPASIVKEKDAERYYDLTHKKARSRIEEKSIQTKGGIGEFVNIEGNCVTALTAATEAMYHHRRPEDRSVGHAIKQTVSQQQGDTGAFFQFEALSPCQHFRGYITGYFEDLKILLQHLGSLDHIYLGKSRTAQYGCTEIHFRQIEKVELATLQWKDTEELTVTCASDMILLNEYGFTVPDVTLLKNDIAEALGVEPDTIRITERYVKYRRIGGFLGVWNLPKTQRIALSAGSVIVLKNKSGRDIDTSILQRTSFGIRTEEGYGQILIDWHGKNDGVLIKKSPDESHSSSMHPAWPAESGFLRELISFILRNHMNTTMRNLALTEADRFADNNAYVKVAFLNRLKNKIKNASSELDLSNWISNLKDTAKKQYERLEDVLYIPKIPDRVKEFLDEKRSQVLESGVKGENQEIFDIIDESAKNLIEGNYFEFYRLFALSFIDILRFKTRRTQQ